MQKLLAAHQNIEKCLTICQSAELFKLPLIRFYGKDLLKFFSFSRSLLIS